MPLILLRLKSVLDPAWGMARAAKLARRCQAAWLYHTPRLLWLALLVIPVAAFFIVVAVIPTYFGGYQRNGTWHIARDAKAKRRPQLARSAEQRHKEDGQQ